MSYYLFTRYLGFLTFYIIILNYILSLKYKYELTFNKYMYYNLLSNKS